MKYLNELDCRGKKVVVRADLNLPMQDGQISDGFRIKAFLPTLNYLIDHGASVVIISHLGRPGGVSKKELSLKPIARFLSDVIGKDVLFLDDCLSKETSDRIKKLGTGQVVFLENLRFYSEEENNSFEFAKQIASYGDVYVNDAFSVSHRFHASIIGIPKILPSYAGLLMEKEVRSLSRVIKNPERPLVAIIGGSKISSKMKVIKSFLEKADDVLLGGALANSIISARGVGIGRSVAEEGIADEVKKLDLFDRKIHLPVDVVVSEDVSGNSSVSIAPVGKIDLSDMILDIGPDTIDLFRNIIGRAKTIVWAGPMGLFEVGAFSGGSMAIAQAVSISEGFSVVGGGDTVACLNELSLLGKIDHISTGGGAMLSFLAEEEMPGLEVLEFCK